MSTLMKSVALGAAVVVGLGTMGATASAAPVAVAVDFQQGMVAPFGDGTELYRGVEDTYLNGGSTSNSSRNNGGGTVMVGNNARGNLALLRFDLTSMQGKYDHVTSASLIVRSSTANNPAMNIYAITAPNGDWVEGSANNSTVHDGSSTYNYMQDWGDGDPRTVDWGSGPGLGVKINDEGTDTNDPAGWGFGPSPLGTVKLLSDNRIQFQIPTSLIEQWINGANYGIVLTSVYEQETDDDGNVTVINNPLNSQVPTFYSSQNGTDGNSARPRLSVSYVVPEPMTGSLLLLSGGLLALRRRKA